MPLNRTELIMVVVMGWFGGVIGAAMAISYAVARCA